MSSADPYRQQVPPAPVMPPLPYGSAPPPAWPAPPAAPYQQVGPYPQVPYPQAMPPAPYPVQPQQPQPYYGGQPAMPPMPGHAVAPAEAPLPMSARATPVPLPAPRPVQPAMPRPAPAAGVAAPAAPRPMPVPARPAPLPAPAANRPQPVPARPVPVTQKPGAAPVVQEETKDEEEKQDQATQAAVRKAPPWLVSLVVHMLIVIGMALAYFSIPSPNQVQLEVVYAEEIGEQVLDDTLQSPESLDMSVDVPALSFDLKPADDPLAAPPELPDNFLEANVATDSIEAPSIGLALTGREAGAKKALLAAYGGNATTEAAVLAGLQWLKKQQKPDGGWSLTGPFPDGAGVENRCSATAMALLAFQGAGHTHKVGEFQKEVQRGWDYLLKTQNADGYFEHEAAHHHRLYAQAQASIAICEIYGMTKDEKFKKPAQLALDFAHKAQAPEGGWRYEPQIDSDTSVTGWYVMALQSGRMAGLEVQSPAEDNIHKFLDKCTQNGALYSYKPGMESTLTMTAEGLLCRQYLGWKHDDERMRRGIDYVLSNPIDYGDQNVYYWYYATQACHHMDGDDWNRWNAIMRQAVPTAQVKTGNEKGSWSPSGDRWGAHGGRLYVTCLSIYMLEVYYRHLPIYKWRLQ
jgi:prenyltransferase beta subunit